MTKECKTSEKQSTLIRPNKSFFAPLRFVSGRLSLEARYIFSFRHRSRLRKSLHDHSGSRGSGGSSLSSCSGTRLILLSQMGAVPFLEKQIFR